MKKKEPIWLKIIRILLGCLFLFSSFTKAVDPVNFGITMNDYFVSFGMGFLHPLAQFAAICAISCEFILGCMMLFRIKPLLAAWGYLLFMVFFFFLTLWLAVAEYLEVHGIHDFGVVKDCGCFGQAVKMSNLQTFLKNVVIIIPTIIVFIFRKRIPESRLGSWIQWFLIFLFAFIAIIFQLHCIRHLPAIDFTDWKKGNDVTSFIEQPAQKDVLFIYKNKTDGQEVTLTQDELMAKEDDFYENFDYVDRKDSIIKDIVRAKIDGFNMLDENGADHAFELISKQNDRDLYVLYMHDLSETNLKGVEKAKQLAADCAEKDIDFVAVTNSSEEDIDKFVALNKLDFPVYHNPIDPVKGPFMVRDAVRSNPGIILFNKGFVVDKWAWRDFPATAR
ncbi:MAG: DoxX family membrane protein [Bacteroidales bacterium]|nr:DoxX family membrane protein [Bacteroidales bacterium]